MFSSAQQFETLDWWLKEQAQTRLQDELQPHGEE